MAFSGITLIINFVKISQKVTKHGAGIFIQQHDNLTGLLCFLYTSNKLKKLRIAR